MAKVKEATGVAKFKCKVQDLYMLSLGLGKYSSYPDTKFARVVYNNMKAISSIISKIDDIVAPLEAYYKGLENISKKYGATEENEYSVSKEHQNSYQGEIKAYIQNSQEIKDREADIRKEQRLYFESDVEVLLNRILFEELPSDFSAQDIEHFKIMIKDL